MRHRSIVPFLVLAAALAGPVHACMADAPLELGDVRFADLVVVGRIANYRVVADPVARREHREWLADYNKKYPENQVEFDETEEFMSDYAQFDVLIDEVLLGEARGRLRATWDNSTFEEPESMAPGPYLIALRRPGAATPPLRGISATILPDPDPDALAVLQAPCSDAFIFESTSKNAAGVRRILATPPKPARHRRARASRSDR